MSRRILSDNSTVSRDQTSHLVPKGTSGVQLISDMVAFRSTRSEGGPIIGMIDIDKLPSTRILIKPRKGPTFEWKDGLAEIVSNAQLSHVLADASEPTLEQVAAQLSNDDYQYTADRLSQLFADIYNTWWTENTKLYQDAFPCWDRLTNNYCRF